MTREDLQRSLDNAHVSMSAHGKNALTGGPVDRLPLRLWDKLRVELQRRYRNATGEEQAVLSVDPPAAPQPNVGGQAGRDIRILLAQIAFLEGLTGEKLEDDDAALVAQIKASYPAAATEEGK